MPTSTLPSTLASQPACFRRQSCPQSNQSVNLLDICWRFISNLISTFCFSTCSNYIAIVTNSTKWQIQKICRFRGQGPSCKKYQTSYISACAYGCVLSGTFLVKIEVISTQFWPKRRLILDYVLIDRRLLPLRPRMQRLRGRTGAAADTLLSRWCPVAGASSAARTFQAIMGHCSSRRIFPNFHQRLERSQHVEVHVPTHMYISLRIITFYQTTEKPDVRS